MSAPRIAPIEPGTRDELRDVEQRILAERGRVSPLYQVLLNSPPIAQGWEQLLTAVRNRSSLPADLRELVILRVAVLNRARYEFDAHVPHAIAAGLGGERIEAVRAEAIGSVFDSRQRAVLELTDAMTRSIDVDDAQFERVRELFDAQGLVDLLVTIAAYNMVSRFLVAAGVGH